MRYRTNVFATRHVPETKRGHAKATTGFAWLMSVMVALSACSTDPTGRSGDLNAVPSDEEAQETQAISQGSVPTEAQREFLSDFAKRFTSSRDLLTLPNYEDKKEVSGSLGSGQTAVLLEYIDKEQDLSNWTKMITIITNPKSQFNAGVGKYFEVYTTSFANSCADMTVTVHRNRILDEIPHKVGFIQCQTKEMVRRATPQLVLRHETLAIKVVEASQAYYVFQSAWHTNDAQPDLPLNPDGSVRNKALYNELISDVEQPEVCVFEKQGTGVGTKCLKGAELSTGYFD